MGAADGDLGRGDGRHRAPAGRRVFGAGAQHAGLRGGAGGRRRRGGDLRLGLGSVFAKEHQLLDRRIDRALPPGGAGGQAARPAPARQHQLRARLPLPGRGAGSSAVADVVRRLRDLGCDEIDIADTIGVGTPHKTQAVLQAAAANSRWSACPAISTTPTARRWPTSTPASKSASRSSIRRWPASAAARTPRARPATSPPKTCCTCCEGWASRPASTSTPWSMPASSSRPHLGRKAVSRAGNAIAAKRAG